MELTTELYAPSSRASGLADPPAFTDPDAFSWFLNAGDAALDRVPFGVVSMALDGTVEHYNLTESTLAGLRPGRVVGRNFFSAVAPCTNNYLVAHRFMNEPDLDAIIDYVFTLRMRPQAVRLRLLRRQDAHRMFVLVDRRV